MKGLPAGDPAIQRRRGGTGQRDAEAEGDEFQRRILRRAGPFGQVRGVVEDECRVWFPISIEAVS